MIPAPAIPGHRISGVLGTGGFAILVNRYGVVGLSDFGLASIIAASGEQSVTRDTLTPAYAAPESFRPHVWETFAIAILPADVMTSDVNQVTANPAIRAVCSLPVLLRSRRPQARLIPPQSWEIDVLPPDEAAYASGARAYRCLAHAQSGPDPRTSEFSP